MVKNTVILALSQLVLACISAFLFAEMSTVGRMGISLTNRQYLFFKTAWKTAIYLAVIQLVLLLVLALFRYWTPHRLTRFIAFLFFLIGLIGYYYTYLDFTTTSHRHLKFYFHLGGYLFWLSWGITCVFFFFQTKKRKPESSSLPSEEASVPLPVAEENFDFNPTEEE